MRLDRVGADAATPNGALFFVAGLVGTLLLFPLAVLIIVLETR